MPQRSQFGVVGLAKLFAGAVSGFIDHNCNRMAAAVAYYTIFSLPAVLVIVISVAGLWFEPADVEGRIRREISYVVGESGAEQVQTMLAHANRPGRGIWGATVGVVLLVFGATGVMAQLQQSLNQIWQVAPKPSANPIWVFLSKRLLSLGMLLTFAFLMLVALVFSAAIAAIGERLAFLLPGEISETVLQVAHTSVSLVLIIALFAVLYRFMPDVRLAWADVLVAALFAGILFELGKAGLAIYLARSDVGSTYGAAGSLALIMLWVYYSSMIFLFGAELTRVWRLRRRGPAEPESGAVRVRTTLETAETSEPDNHSKKRRHDPS